MTEDDERWKRDRERWMQARDLADVAECTALWAEGVLHFQPADAPEPYEETAPLVDVLAAINRAGLVTNFSQPGDDDPEWRQRAAVGGFCDEATTRLAEQLAGTDLVMLSHYPGSVDLVQVPVTMDGAVANTWVGAQLGSEDLHHYYAADLHPQALAALIEAWQVDIFDPSWGRTDYMWPLVLGALEGGPDAVG